MKKWGMLVCLAAMALVVNIGTSAVSQEAIYDPEPKVIGPDIYDPDPYFVQPNQL